MRPHATFLTFAIALAACSSEGVSIEVRRGSTTAARVELYIVDDACFSDAERTIPCPQLKTPSARVPLAGDVYTREDARTLSNEIEGDGANAAAHFIIKADGDRTRIPLAFAVGFDADGKRVGAAAMVKEFYTTDGNRHIVTLEEIIEDKVTGEAAVDGLRAETWYQDPNLGGGCLALEHRVGLEFDRTFIVPVDDPDCDGWVAPDECDAMWPNHTKDDDDTQLQYTCVSPAPVLLGTACLIGDAPCIDGEGPAKCKPTQTSGNLWCLPSALCDSICQNSDNRQCLYSALQHPTLPLPTKHPTYVHCEVPVLTENPAVGHNVCGGGLITQLGPYLASSGAPPRCSSLQLGRVTPTAIGPFSNSIARTVMGAQNGNTISVALEEPCGLQISFAGTFPPTPMTNVLPEHVAKLDLDGYSLVVPVVIDLRETAMVDCVNAMATCVFVTADPNQTGVRDESLVSCAGG